MRARVSGRIAPFRALMKLETLIGETPAAIATSRRVTCPRADSAGDLARSDLKATLFSFSLFAGPGAEERLDPDWRLSLDFIQLRLILYCEISDAQYWKRPVPA